MRVKNLVSWQKRRKGEEIPIFDLTRGFKSGGTKKKSGTHIVFETILGVWRVTSPDYINSFTAKPDDVHENVKRPLTAIKFEIRVSMPLYGSFGCNQLCIWVRLLVVTCSTLKWVLSRPDKAHIPRKRWCPASAPTIYLIKEAATVDARSLINIMTHCTGPNSSNFAFVSEDNGVEARNHTPPFFILIAVDLPPTGIHRNRVKGRENVQTLFVT